MDTEAFPASQSNDVSLTIPHSISTPNFSEIEDHHQPPPPSHLPLQSRIGASSSSTNKPNTLHRCKTAPALMVTRNPNPVATQIPRPNTLHRCKTAPALVVIRNPNPVATQIPRSNTLHRCKTAPDLVVIRNPNPVATQIPRPPSDSGSIVKLAISIMVYFCLGVLIYSLNRKNFSGIETHPVVDALYFCIVTLCTIGYGDITPLTPWTKIFVCFFVLLGLGFLDVLLSGLEVVLNTVVNYLLSVQESYILAVMGICKPGTRPNRERSRARDYMFDVEKGRMKIRLKVGVALVVVLLCIGAGFLVLYFVEDLSVIDSFYLSVMSATAVGYGDRAFKTLKGRLFAAVWLLVSTLAVARAFLFLAEARIDRRHRSITKWALHRDITVEDLIEADNNHYRYISKAEFIVFKLKEMGKIEHKDIVQVADRFSKLDPNGTGKIHVHDLLQNYIGT